MVGRLHVVRGWKLMNSRCERGKEAGIVHRLDRHCAPHIAFHGSAGNDSFLSVSCSSSWLKAPARLEDEADLVSTPALHYLYHENHVVGLMNINRSGAGLASQKWALKTGCLAFQSLLGYRRRTTEMKACRIGLDNKFNSRNRHPSLMK